MQLYGQRQLMFYRSCNLLRGLNFAEGGHGEGRRSPFGPNINLMIHTKFKKIIHFRVRNLGMYVVYVYIFCKFTAILLTVPSLRKLKLLIISLNTIFLLIYTLKVNKLNCYKSYIYLFIHVYLYLKKSFSKLLK